MVTAQVKKLGQRVFRGLQLAPTQSFVHPFGPGAGPDWRWGNQDGHGPGEIIDLNPDRSNPNWFTVRWASGLKNNYRVGVDGEFDLVTPEPAVGYSVDVVQAVSGKVVGVGRVGPHSARIRSPLLRDPGARGLMKSSTGPP